MSFRATHWVVYCKFRPMSPKPVRPPKKLPVFKAPSLKEIWKKLTGDMMGYATVLCHRRCPPNLPGMLYTQWGQEVLWTANHLHLASWKKKVNNELNPLIHDSWHPNIFNIFLDIFRPKKCKVYRGWCCVWWGFTWFHSPPTQPGATATSRSASASVSAQSPVVHAAFFESAYIELQRVIRVPFWIFFKIRKARIIKNPQTVSFVWNRLFEGFWHQFGWHQLV